MTIGENIKTRREKLGITQETLSKKIGCKDKSSISKIEHGPDGETIERLRKIAKELKCSINDLIDE